MMTTQDFPEIRAAMRYLHSVCDGVHDKDAKGYGAADRPAADRLAKLPQWTLANARLAYSIITRHRRQLTNAGFDFNAIPRPSDEAFTQEQDREARADVRAAARKVDDVEKRNISASSTHIVVNFPFDAAVKDDLKASVSLIRWDAGMKRWHVALPVPPGDASALLAFADRHQFKVHENARLKLEASIKQVITVQQKAEQLSAESHPPSDKRIITLQRGNGVLSRFIVHFPYDAIIKDALKVQARARWDAGNRYWWVEVSPTTIEGLTQFAETFQFEWTPDAKAYIDEASGRFKSNMTASRAVDADIKVPGMPDGIQLRPFQRGGVRFALDNCHDGKGVMIADEMGLGKTPQALSTLVTKNAFPALAVVPANVLFNWKAEAKKFFPNLRVKVLKGSEAPPATSSMDGGPSYHLYILSYDNLYKHTKAEHIPDARSDPKRLHDYQVQVRTGTDPESAAKLAGITLKTIHVVTGRFEKIGLKGLVFDESHYVKNYKARRTLAAEAFSNIPTLETTLTLTGTMIANTPGEAIAQLKIIRRLDDVGGFWFIKRIDNMPTNTEQQRAEKMAECVKLHERLMQTCMVRRLKADVLPELPAKQRTEVITEIDNRKEYQHAEDDLLGWLEKVHGTPKDPGPAEALVRINALRLVAAKGKLNATKQWVEDFLESGQKLVLFAHHRQVIDSLATHFPGCVTITGDMSPEERQKSVEQFQNDKDVRLVIASLQAASVGLTLTAASNVAFLEMGWTPALHDQAEDRVHRIGQKSDSVNAWYLLGNDTIDEYMYTLINEKRVVMNAVHDGKIDTERSSILNDLIRKLKGK